MLSPRTLAEFTRTCTAIGNSVADPSGFVAVPALLNRFQAVIHVRPLLVEAMLAKTDDAEKPWAVLIDAERYPFSATQITEETQSKPLPDRLRNTIAHELTHSLPYRIEQFGMKLPRPTDGDMRELVAELEHQIEQLSPLLLLPGKTLGSFVARLPAAVTVTDLERLRRENGLSRYTLINRLNLLSPTDENRARAGLRNVAVGIGVWQGEKATLRKWPLFTNFVNNVVPDFLHQLRRQDYLSFGELSPRYQSSASIPELVCRGGTPSAPDAQEMRVQLAMEASAPRNGPFLFTAHKVT